MGLSAKLCAFSGRNEKYNMGIIVLAVIIFILWKWRGLRAYIAASLCLIGIGAAIAGCIMEDHFFLLPGIIMTVIGGLIAFLSVIRHEKSQWFYDTVHFLIYGFWLFVRFFAVCLIIGLPLLALFNSLCEDWEEVVVVDSYGRDTGRRATINSKGEDVYGNRYTKRD